METPFFLTIKSYRNIKYKFNNINSVMKKVCNQNYMTFRLSKISNSELIGTIKLLTKSAKIGFNLFNTETIYGKVRFRINMNENNIYHVNIFLDANMFLNLNESHIKKINDFLKNVAIYITSDLNVIYPTNYIIELYTIIDGVSNNILENFILTEELNKRIRNKMILPKLEKWISLFCIQSDLKIKDKKYKTLKKIGKISIQAPRSKIQFYNSTKSHHSYKSNNSSHSDKTNNSSHKKTMKSNFGVNYSRKKKLIESEPSNVNVNIGLLLITCHGNITYTSSRLGNPPFIDIPDTINNTYYRSYSKPGLSCWYTPSAAHSPQVSPTFEEDEIFEYDENIPNEQVITNLMNMSNSKQHQRYIYENAFKKFKNKLFFYKEFFNIGFNYKKQYMKSIKHFVTNDMFKFDKDLLYNKLQNNKKVTKVLNKYFTSTPNVKENKIIFLLYNTHTKRYQKFNLIDLTDLRKVINDIILIHPLFNIDESNRTILQQIIDMIVVYNLLSFKNLLYLLQFFNLEYLYIYDESCDSYNLNEDLKKYYMHELPENERLTEQQINEEITKEIYREANIENVGI